MGSVLFVWAGAGPLACCSCFISRADSKIEVSGLVPACWHCGTSLGVRKGKVLNVRAVARLLGTGSSSLKTYKGGGYSGGSLS